MLCQHVRNFSVFAVKFFGLFRCNLTVVTVACVTKTDFVFCHDLRGRSKVKQQAPHACSIVSIVSAKSLTCVRESRSSLFSGLHSKRCCFLRRDFQVPMFSCKALRFVCWFSLLYAFVRCFPVMLRDSPFARFFLMLSWRFFTVK